MLPVAQFYAPERWGNRHGIKDPRFYGETGHRGLDIRCAGREEIPALRTGTVVLSTSVYSRSSILGYYAVLRYAFGDYDGYCHLWDGDMPKLGSVIRQGQKVARAASWGDYTGSAWSGPHLHLTNGPNPTSVHTDPRRNPEDVVRRVLATIEPAAGGELEEIVAITLEDIRKAVWLDARLARRSDEELFSPGSFLTDTHDNAEKALANTKALVSDFETAHPDPARAAKGERHRDTLLQRVGAIHADTWLLPGIKKTVDSILQAVSKPTAELAVSDAQLDAALGRVLEARGLTVQAIVVGVADEMDARALARLQAKN